MDHPVLPGLFVVEVQPLDTYEEKNHARVDKGIGRRSTGSTASAHEVIRSCQREGLRKASEHQDRIWRLMFQHYALYGSLTDAEMAEHLGIQRSTVNARRNEHPEVVAVGARKNQKSGVTNTLWGMKR